ncbi:MAG TPA: peptidoglycan-binding domain-containing protein [Bryobacteraceae bacterium]|jgi:peptidoglycan hydrolase-like protein with peptidoglycan-binding domain|nr:peptidoglycan-binding domain-containing protein [Bryobacteraceae bacterium]
MKYALTLFLFTVLATSLALPQAPAASTARKKTPTKAAPATKKTAVSTKKAKSSKKPVVAATSRNRQLTPTPERYKEIQQALADKGYLKSEPNGVWDTESTDALRQFQTDKNLSPTGKISAASLIDLGLGPKTGETSLDTSSVPSEPPSAQN